MPAKPARSVPLELASKQEQNSNSYDVGLNVGGIDGRCDGLGVGIVDGIGLGDGLGI